MFSNDLSIAILLLAAALVGALGFWVVYRAIRSYQTKRRFARGAQGEELARKYLLLNGFEILSSQAQLTATVSVNGENRDYTIRADYLVRRRGRTGIVEVKTGNRAIDPTGTDTRRQLFEYYHLFRPDDVYLFDAEHGELMTSRFSGSTEKPLVSYRWIWGALMGSAITLGALIFWGKISPMLR